jgi:peptidoglycan/xylan/chitin deacetylase (PgdA/CDA1 family)
MNADLFTARHRSRTTRRAPWTLMYHSVGDTRHDPYLVTVSPERLAAQLRWLNRHGLTGVSMRELLAARAAGRDQRLVGLTFDDGYVDFLRLAVPALRQHGHTATVFVLPGRLGGTNEWDPDGPSKPLLDAAGIREAAAAGMEIGSHGLLHLDLTGVDDTTLTAEVGRSRELLAEVTGTPPVGFCYPYGVLDARTVAAVRQAGYTYGCAISPGPLTSLHALPRTHVGNRETGPRLHAKRLLHGIRSRALPALGEADAAALAAAPQQPRPPRAADEHRDGPARTGAPAGPRGEPERRAARTDPAAPRAGEPGGGPASDRPAPMTDSPGGHP